jgi:FkbM family methyltransferase
MGTIREDAIEAQVRGLRLLQYAPTEILRMTAELIGALEPETLDWLDEMEEGSCLFDVGASNGMYAHYAAARRSVRTVAFEPEAQNFATLEMNAFLNKHMFRHQPIGLCLALSDTEGLGKIFCARYGAGFHMKILDRPFRVNEGEPFVPDHVQSVMQLPLDTAIGRYGLPIPQYLKIDVDGAEERVLAGAKQTLGIGSTRSVMIELSDHGEAMTRATNLLEAAGYRLRHRFPVRHAKGGHYEGLFNCVFERGSTC